MKKGIFIVLEGPEGSGKTSAIYKLGEFLQNQDIEYISTREPGGIAISEQIREVILNVENTKMDGKTEALLYAAARRQHLVEKVIPALNSGKIVICDRFVAASLAYQGFARGLGIDEVMKINEFAIEGYMPDLTLLFDVDPVIGLERIAKNKDREVNRLDKESLEFHYKVREAYKIIANRYSDSTRIIDASKSFEDVVKQMLQYVREFIAERGFAK